MENLKVGMSFEVVEVLTTAGYDGLFKVGGFTIDLTGIGQMLTNGVYYNCIDRKRFNQYCALIPSSEVKPIGRLTITSLK